MYVRGHGVQCGKTIKNFSKICGKNGEILKKEKQRLTNLKDRIENKEHVLDTVL